MKVRSLLKEKRKNSCNQNEKKKNIMKSDLIGKETHNYVVHSGGMSHRGLTRRKNLTFLASYGIVKIFFFKTLTITLPFPRTLDSPSNLYLYMK